jgi:hypothetical protein
MQECKVALTILPQHSYKREKRGLVFLTRLGMPKLGPELRFEPRT